MNFNAINIGQAAWQVWSHDQPATVIGVTSRGLFLSIDQRVLFISFERWRGPLTINLDRSLDQLLRLEVGIEAFFANARLIFPASAISLAVSAAEVWHTPAPVSPPCPIDQRREIVQQITRLVTAQASDRGFTRLLNPLLGLPPSGSLSYEQSVTLNSLRTLQQALRTHDFAAVLDNISRLLGRGSGLTPSGDDCVLGLLLMLNRWQANRDWRDLNQAVIDAAFQKTTTISANLIECAAAGQADERLLNVVDGIVTGEPGVEECADSALEWGSSSGIDALAGMAIAL